MRRAVVAPGPGCARVSSGQFISPLSIVWLKDLSGTLSRAVLCYAVACLLACSSHCCCAGRRQSRSA